MGSEMCIRDRDDTNLSNESDDVDDGKYNVLNFSLANARSLSGKIKSLIDMFNDAQLDFAILNETWFQCTRKLEGDLEDMKLGENIELICKNRQSRGGGVAIAFKNTRVKLKRLPIRGNKFELVAAVGRSMSDKRTIAVYSLYIPPKQSAAATKEMYSCISDSIEKMKLDYADPAIIIAGDTNRRELGTCVEDYPDIVVLDTCLLYTSDAADE